MSSALDKVVLAAGWGAELEDSANQLVLAAQVAVRELAALAKSDDAGDGDSDDDGDGDDQGSGHSSHGTYKALIKKGVKPAMAAKMCARSDKKVAASALAESADVILSAMFAQGSGTVIALAAPPGESASDRRSLAAKGWALPSGAYPIPDKKHLHSAAVLAASKHGNWKAAQSLIRKRAKELGVELSSLPGFGEEKVEASMVALAAVTKPVKGTEAVAHPPFHGVHAHAHVHTGDNMHGGASDRYAVG